MSHRGALLYAQVLHSLRFHPIVQLPRSSNADEETVPALQEEH